ncbi:MAG: TraR/DksA family transcriptional regulator [Geminicoccaceae bacterium]
MTGEKPSERAKIEARLKERRGSLEALIEGHGEDGKPVALDQTRVGRLSRMDALQNQAMAQETERRRQVELAQIDGALRRLEDGTYGDCIDCGEPIAEKRLELDPSALLCIDCAGKDER